MASDVPDVVPLLAFDALDFIEQTLDVRPTDWQKRILIDQFGPGPEPDEPAREDVTT